MEKVGISELLAQHEAAMLQTGRRDEERLNARRALKAALSEYRRARVALYDAQVKEAQLRQEIAGMFVPYSESATFDAALVKEVEEV